MENIDFVGRAITVQSESGPEVTIIDGNQAGSVIKFCSGESTGSIIEGFTIQNGSGTYSGGMFRFGGGLHCDNTSPTIINNNIIGNEAETGGGISSVGNSCSPSIIRNRIIDNKALGGGGISCGSSSIRDNIISNNYAWGYGGGIYCEYLSYATISNNIISGNTTVLGGGGIYCDSATIINNTITDNMATDTNGFAGGISCSSHANTITNTISWGNYAMLSNEIHIYPFGNAVITYCNVGGGWPGTGNIDAKPLFADTANNDYHLTWNSPCRNTGDNNAVTELYDFEGDPRIAQGTVDMGADEFHPHLHMTGTPTPGSPVDVKIIGEPNQRVLLALSNKVVDPPNPTPHGDLFLKLPLLAQWNLGMMNSDGVKVMSANIPTGWASGSEHPFQAFVGTWGVQGTLTNLMHVTVK